MIDPDGIEWLPLREAAARVDVPWRTVRSWVDRGKVRAHTVLARTYVAMPDVARAEHDTRARYQGLRERRQLQ